MPENGIHDSSSFSESFSLVALESGQSVSFGASTPQPSDGQNSNHEERSGDCSVDPPPLVVKLTGYRLVTMATVFSFGTVKAILTYTGHSIAPTTLDWVSGTFLAVVLYWIGLYEGSNRFQWFFQVDLTPAILPAIGFFAKCVVAGVVWVLSHYAPFSLTTSLSLLASPACYSLALRSPGFPYNFLCVFILVHFLIDFCMRRFWYGVGRLTRQVRVLNQGWQRVIGFVNIYGPGAPRAERYGWLGVVGAIVGCLCGIALLLLPISVALFYWVNGFD